MTQPQVSVASRLLTACTVSLPTPGQEKTDSTTALPASIIANVFPMLVMMGISALPNACLRMTRFSGTPFALAVRVIRA